LGLFLAFQYPVAIPGVTVANFLRSALNARRRSENPDDKGVPIPEFRKLLKEKMSLLKMDHNFAGRYLNDGFSGGEKKRAEILQMATLKPEIAILDETDSGLDIDALRVVADGVNALMGSDMGVLVITHYQRLLNYIKPDFVHVMFDGLIVESGGPELALQLEEQGYEWVREKYQKTVAQKTKEL
jgi:Fe-S cluster assembly ATP-binding protein